MSVRIYKWPINDKTGTARIPWSRGDKVVHVAYHRADNRTAPPPGWNYYPCVWTESLDTSVRGELEITVVGTGDAVPVGWWHVGSALSDPDAFVVWHVYARVIPDP